MKVKTVGFLSIVLSMFLFCSNSFGDNILHFRLDVDEPIIGIGEEAVISVLGWAEDAATDNGLVFWEASLTRIDGAPSGVVGVKGGDWETGVSYNEPWTTRNVSVVDSPLGGNVDTMGIYLEGSTSPIGVGDYYLLAEVTVVGGQEGTVEFSLTSGNESFGGSLADMTDLVGSFEGPLELTVVPEPATLLMLGLAGITLRKRK